MVFGFFKKIAAPTIFSKGLGQYQQGQYGIARQLFVKAHQWMPALAEDALYQAAMLLCDHHLDRPSDTSQAQVALDALTASPHKDTAQYSRIITEIKTLLDATPPAEKNTDV